MKTAVKHWSLLRLASLPLIPLAFYFIAQANFLATKSRMVFVSWVKQPETAAAIVVFILCSFFHACLGVDEIIEDYVSSKPVKAAALLANKIFFAVLGALSLYATIAIFTGKF